MDRKDTDRVLWGDLMVLFNSDDKNEFWSSQQGWIIVSWKLHSSSGVHTLVTDIGLIIHILVEKNYPLRKEVLKQMLKLKLESEEENTMALELIKLVRKILAEHKNWLVHKQTAYGKDFSNLFMVDNLPKIVRFSTHLASVVKSWLVHDQTVHALASPNANELTIPEQTATGKGTSNPLMAASNWLERLPAGSITTREDLTTRFLAQLFPLGRTTKLYNDILMFPQHHRESISEAWTRFKELLQKVPHHGIDLWLQDLALYNNESWNDPRDFAKSVKAIALPQDVPSTSDRRLIELENQVQCLMEAHLAPTQPTQVNKITTSCEICSGPHDTQYCMENPKQAFVKYASSRTDEAREGLVSEFMSSQDARLSKFEANFKQQQSKMIYKIDTVLKAITDRIAGTLPSNTVKNPKLGTTLVFSARSYPTEDLQCLTHIYSSINAITIHPKQPKESQDNEPDVGQEEKGNLGNINSNPHPQPNPLASIITK
ncbi:MAK10-like protein [Tanacetum coccineum]